MKSLSFLWVLLLCVTVNAQGVYQNNFSLPVIAVTCSRVLKNLYEKK